MSSVIELDISLMMGCFGGDLKDVEFGWPIGMPLCRPLGNGLWEVRNQVTSGRVAKLILCMADLHIVDFG